MAAQVLRDDVIAFRGYLERNRAIFEEELALLAGEEDWEAVRAWATHAASPEERAVKAILWCRFFIPQYFRDETPDFHFDVAYYLFSLKNEYFAAPRGHGKTTVIQGCIAFAVAHGFRRFIVVVEKTFTEASEVLAAVREEFESNVMIGLVYGKKIGKLDDGTTPGKAKDAEGDILIAGVRLRAKGFNAPIRGLKDKEWRPDWIICDDIESDEHINSEDQRIKYASNYTQGIIPAVDVDCFVKMAGTLLHHDSLLNNLIEQHNGYIYRSFELHDPEGTLLWPTRWTYERLMEKKAQMAVRGFGSSKFFQEYLNIIQSEEGRAFRPEWLEKTYSPPEIRTRFLNRYITIDVADSLKDGADYTGVIVNDWSSDNLWFLRHVKRYRVNSTGLVDLIFELWEEWKPLKIGVEKKAFEDQVKPLLAIKALQTGIRPIVVELQPLGRNKEDRIRGALQGRFEYGMILFDAEAKDDSHLLKGELLDFPRGKNDDLCDGLAYQDDIGKAPFVAAGKAQTITEKEFFDNKKGDSFKKKQSIISRL